MSEYLTSSVPTSDTDNIDYKAVGKHIRYLRKMAGLTQEELALRIGYVSRASVNQIELGKKSVPKDKFKALADAFGLSVEDFANECGLNSRIVAVRLVSNTPVAVKEVPKGLLENLFQDDQKVTDILKRCETVMMSKRLALMPRENKELIKLALITGLKEAKVIK